MKLKKENKAFAMYNFRLYVNAFNNEKDYKVLSKELRTQFNNVPYYHWCRRWFPYKNLELNCVSIHTSFILI